MTVNFDIMEASITLQFQFEICNWLPNAVQHISIVDISYSDGTINLKKSFIRWLSSLRSSAHIVWRGEAGRSLYVS